MPANGVPGRVEKGELMGYLGVCEAEAAKRIADCCLMLLSCRALIASLIYPGYPEQGP